MKRKIRFRNIFLIWRYWRLFERCDKMMTDPKANVSMALMENLTLEEMDGVETLATFFRLLSMETDTLGKELKDLDKSTSL